MSPLRWGDRSRKGYITGLSTLGVQASPPGRGAAFLPANPSTAGSPVYPFCPRSARHTDSVTFPSTHFFQRDEETDAQKVQATY